jgi:hypothetical protein
MALEQKNQILSGFGQQFPEIMSYIKQEQTANHFAVFWSMLLMVVYCYNFFMCLWLMMFEGFPTGFWLIFEVTAEVVYMIDFAARLIFPRYFPRSWHIMFLLHDHDDEKSSAFTRRVLSSFPTHIFLSGVLHEAQLRSFWVAALRLLKILRYRKFARFFEVEPGSAKARFVAVLDILIQACMGLHFVTFCFLLPGRF